MQAGFRRGTGFSRGGPGSLFRGTVRLPPGLARFVMRRMFYRALALGMLVLASSAADARAQGFISPLIGFDFGGDSGCPTASDCEDKNSNIGVALGTLRAVGYEAEFAYARSF